MTLTEQEKEILYPYFDDDDLRTATETEIEYYIECDEPFSKGVFPVLANEGKIVKFEVKGCDCLETQFYNTVEVGNNAEYELEYLARLIKVDYIKDKIVASYEIRSA